MLESVDLLNGCGGYDPLKGEMSGLLSCRSIALRDADLQRHWELKARRIYKDKGKLGDAALVRQSRAGGEGCGVCSLVA